MTDKLVMYHSEDESIPKELVDRVGWLKTDTRSKETYITSNRNPSLRIPVSSDRNIVELSVTNLGNQIRMISNYFEECINKKKEQVVKAKNSYLNITQFWKVSRFIDNVYKDTLDITDTVILEHLKKAKESTDAIAKHLYERREDRNYYNILIEDAEECIIDLERKKETILNELGFETLADESDGVDIL